MNLTTYSSTNTHTTIITHIDGAVPRSTARDFLLFYELFLFVLLASCGGGLGDSTSSSPILCRNAVNTMITATTYQTIYFN